MGVAVDNTRACVGEDAQGLKVHPVGDQKENPKSEGEKEEKDAQGVQEKTSPDENQENQELVEEIEGVPKTCLECLEENIHLCAEDQNPGISTSNFEYHEVQVPSLPEELCYDMVTINRERRERREERGEKRQRILD